MRLNHINLAVSDVPASRAFLETYFEMNCVSDDSPETIVVMLDDAKNVITLSNFKKVEAVEYPGAFHVGFSQPSRAEVDALHRRLSDDGFGPGRPKEFHGAWTFYMKAPGGFMVEVLHQHEAFG